jgi:ribose/xylose/arabinose/galactoside ABC-type transport system permease subunit
MATNRWRGGSTRADIRRYLQTASLFISLGVLWLVLSLLSPVFFTTNNIINIFVQSSVIGILAAGFTLVLIAGEIDLSITSVLALASVVSGVLIIKDNVPVILALVLTIGVGVVVGVVNAYFTTLVRLPSFIVTLAMLGIGQGLAFVLTGAQTVEGYPHSYTVIGQGKVGNVPILVFIAGGVYLILHFVLSQTSTGMNIYAVGGSRRAADLIGLRSGRTVLLTFMISGGLAALAGIILSAQLNAAQGSFGQTDLFGAIAAVVIGGASLNGGAGTLLGTAGGVLVISTIDDGLVLLGVSPFWVQVVLGLIILGAVMIDRLIKGELQLGELIPAWPHA